MEEAARLALPSRRLVNHPAAQATEGWGMPEAAKPLLPKRWSKLVTATTAFGHGFAVQRLGAHMAVAGAEKKTGQGQPLTRRAKPGGP